MQIKLPLRHRLKTCLNYQDRQEKVNYFSLCDNRVTNVKSFERTLGKVRLEEIEEKWNLENHLQEIKSKWEAIEKCHWTMDSMGEKLEKEYEKKFTEIEKSYDSIRKEISAKIWENVHKQTTAPRMDIPEFYGNYGQWLTFKDLFLETIHNNHLIPRAIKMQHLKSKLRGEAEKLVQHLNITAENYDSCWEILNQRFNNKRLLFTSLMNNMLNLSNIQQPNAFNIKKMHDIIIESLNGLHNLGIEVATWDPIIVHLMAQKLDATTFGEYTRELKNPRELPELDEFAAFLENKFMTLEAQKNRQKPESSQAQQNTTSARRSQSFPRQNNGYQTGAGYNTFLASTKYCPLCKRNDHVLMYCRKFQRMEPRMRKEFVTKVKICQNCLYDHDHGTCNSTKKCKHCQQPHHSLLHINGNEALANSSSRSNLSQAKQCYTSHVSNEIREVLLATVQLKVKTLNGDYVILRALLDQGSQVCLITERAAQLINLPRSKLTAVVTGVGEALSGNCKGTLQLECQSIYSKYDFRLKVIIMNKLVGNLPNVSFKTNKWPHLQNLELADPDFNLSRSVDLLLGADVYASIILEGVVRGKYDGPVAQKTRLGWVLSGSLQSFQCNLTTVDTDSMKRFWETEDITADEDCSSSTSDNQCEEFYQKTTWRRDDGRYVVQMPLKQDFKEKLGASRARAVSQFLQLEKRFERQPRLASMYKDFLKEYSELGHMSISDIQTTGSQYFLPHHGVLRESSTTTKLRVVFNASMKTSSGFSLNDLMERGPNLQKDLQSLIMKWRSYKVVFTADIEKMYRQILIDEEQHYLQQIVWRETPTARLKNMKLERLTYGTRSAPFLAMRTLKQLAIDDGSKFPTAAKILLNETYMDDVISGADSLASALNIKKELMSLLSGGGFHLRKWSSNDLDMLNCLPRDQIASENLFDFKYDDSMKTLGLSWNPKTDAFLFKWDIPATGTADELTKRQLLSEISKLYDPLGFVSPTTVEAKLLFQRVWLAKIDWDQVLPYEIASTWIKLREELSYLKQVKIPRWMGSPRDVIQLHGFCDASEKCYACVVYSYIYDTTGETKIIIIAAKTRVVPLQQKPSIPRLELCGALLLAKLMKKITTSFADPPLRVRAWSDSKVVLAWLQGDVSRWDCYVRNRVLKIKESIPSEHWGYIKSEDNPADCASRGLFPKRLVEHRLWWNGPDLSLLKENQEKDVSLSPPEICGNVLYVSNQQKSSHQDIVKESSFVDYLLKRHSSLTHIQRITAWVARFVTRLREKQTECPNYLSVKEITNAMTIIVKHCQALPFASELKLLKKKAVLPAQSKILKLDPFLDGLGVLRVGGRFSQIPYNMKQPTLLPHDGIITQLVINHAHQQTLHGGARLTLAYLRMNYWIIGGNKAVKNQIRRCVRCHRFKTQQSHQVMGNLPETRVVPSRPFTHTGIDFTGKVDVKLKKGKGISLRVKDT